MWLAQGQRKFCIYCLRKKDFYMAIINQMLLRNFWNILMKRLLRKITFRKTACSHAKKNPKVSRNNILGRLPMNFLQDSAWIEKRLNRCRLKELKKAPNLKMAIKSIMPLLAKESF